MSSPKYRWEETISFVRMEDWVSRATETSFVYALKSQLTCEANYMTSSLSTLVCDCVGDGGILSLHPTACFSFLFSFLPSESCFPSDIETEVGISGACAGDSSVLKGPSSFTEFSADRSVLLFLIFFLYYLTIYSIVCLSFAQKLLFSLFSALGFSSPVPLLLFLSNLRRERREGWC